MCAQDSSLSSASLVLIFSPPCPTLNKTDRDPSPGGQLPSLAMTSAVFCPRNGHHRERPWSPQQGLASFCDTAGCLVFPVSDTLSQAGFTPTGKDRCCRMLRDHLNHTDLRTVLYACHRHGHCLMDRHTRSLILEVASRTEPGREGVVCPGKDGVWPGERLGGHELHCLQEVVQEDPLCVGRSVIRSAPVMGSICSLPR